VGDEFAPASVAMVRRGHAEVVRRLGIVDADE
jgi:hypothetical protein